MKILSIASVFPNVSEPGLALFVEARLQAIAELAEVRVVAPIAPFDYDNPSGRGFGRRTVPRSTTRGRLEVLHPAWVYPPGNPAIKGVLLAAQLYPMLRRLRRTFAYDVIDAQFTHPEGVAAGILAKALDRPYTITMRGN